MYKTRRVSGALDLIALVILVAETVMALFIAVGYGVYALLDSDSPELSAALAAVMAVFAAGVGVFAWGFAKHRRFALSGALVWQLKQASVGVWLLAAWPLVGAALIVLATAVTVAVVRRLAAYGKAEAMDVS